MSKNVTAAERIEGDARPVLEGMRAAPGEHDLTDIKAAIDEEARRDGERRRPLMAVLDDVLGADGILAADSTQAAYYGAVHFLPMDARRRHAGLRAAGRDRGQARRARPPRRRADRRRRSAPAGRGAGRHRNPYR